MAPVRLTGVRERHVTLNPAVLLLSLALQLTFALLFGHFYDTRIFMATGYLVGTGQNPYVAQDLTAVFNNVFFQGITTAGYPPPWPLVLGLVYRSVYATVPNFLLYNLALKLPILAANIGLAYLAADILKQLGAEAPLIRRAWGFLLLNPCLLYFTSAWGQFDVIVALLSLLALALLQAGKLSPSAVLLALAISLKPIGLPILPVALVFLTGKSARQAVHYSVVFLASAGLFCVAPFTLFGWDPSLILQGWNAHFTVAGGMSVMTFYELWRDSYQLPGQWWLLGLAWIPALGLGLLGIQQGITGFADLLAKSTGMVMLFYLTRTWLSEPNIILILPFVLILTSIGRLNRLALAAVWILPLVFTVFNTSPAQLLFPSFPGVMVSLLKFADDYRVARLIVRIVLVVPWEIAGWWIVITCFRRSPTQPAPVAERPVSWK